MKYALPLICLLLIAAWSCDEIASTESSVDLFISSFTVSPQEISFASNMQLKDTTITIEIELLLKQQADADFSYTITRQGDVISEGKLQQKNLDLYAQSIDIEVNTGISQNLSVFVFAPGSPGSETAEATIRIKSEITEPPVILEAYNTESVQIPASGNERIDFFAKVSHPGGQILVDRVEFFMIDQDGNRLGEVNPGDDPLFEMYDDGEFNESAGRIDEIAGDSLYSRALFINPQNNPAEYDVFYFATSSNGFSSDTLQTTLQIVE